VVFIGKNIKKSLIMENKYDDIVVKIVNDVIQIYKRNKEGEFVLPEDIGDEMTYHFPELDTDFTVELIMDLDESVEEYDVDANYYRDEDTIELRIVSNPKLGKKIPEEMISDLEEHIRHEIEHMIQHLSGYEFPDDEPSNPIDYYSQPHELDAQRAGFNVRAKKEKKSLESVAKNWFEKNKKKHRLSDEEIKKIVNKILNKN
jgi:hypothetical protein